MGGDGPLSNRKTIKIRGLSNVKISKVCFFVKTITQGLQYYSGISIHDAKGNLITQQGDFRKGEWCEYYLEEDEVIFGLYGQYHIKFGYIVKLGLITNKSRSSELDLFI